MVDFTAPTAPTVPNGSPPTLAIPLRNGSIDIPKIRFPSTSTPLLKNALTISSNPFPALLADPFAEDDGYTQGRGRKRTKFARQSDQWRLTDASEKVPEAEWEDTIPDQATSKQRVPNSSIIDLVDDSSSDVSVLSEERQLPIRMEGKTDDVTGKRETRDREASPIDEEESVATVEKTGLVSAEDDLKSNEHLPSQPLGMQTPVERQSTDENTTPSVLTPSLTALASPEIPMLSSTTARAHIYADLPQPTSYLDVNDRIDDHAAVDMLPVQQKEPSSFTQITQFDIQPHSGSNGAAVTDILEGHMQQTLPAEMPETAEIDLDKLQEQIDMSNADFLREAHSQVVEDEDMYGPPQDREAGMELQHIDEIRTRISSVEPQAVPGDQQLAPSTQEFSSNDHDGGLGGLGGLVGGVVSRSTNGSHGSNSQQVSFVPPVPDQMVFQPYPSHFEHHSAVAEPDELDNVHNMEVEIPPASPSRSNQGQLQFLDGSLDVQAISGTSPRDAYVSLTDDLGLVQTGFILPADENGALPEATDPVVTSVEDNMDEVPAIQGQEHPPSSSQVGQLDEPDGTVPISAAAQDTIQSIQYDSWPGAAVNAMTPEATQVTGPDIASEAAVESYVREQLPPTPDESQPQMAQEDRAKTTMLSNVDVSQSADAEVTHARPTPSKELQRPGYAEGIASPYFTLPAPSSVPDAAMQSMRVPGTSKMRLRSSSPADLPVDHLESERLAALAMSTNDISSTSNENQILPVTQVGMTTPLEYYARLNALNEYYNQLVDVTAACVVDSVTPERAKFGPKDFFTTIFLADPSIQDPGTTITAQIFRPRKTALPTVSRGDIVLLRRFKVQTQSHKPILLSTDESAWAVYKIDPSSGKNGPADTTVTEPPIVSGPPIEYGPFEGDNATRLLQWWLTEGMETQYEKAVKSSPHKSSRLTAGKQLEKPPQDPTDLRRSPRRTRKVVNIDTTSSPTSPAFEPESPALSHATILSTQHHTGPHSPDSIRSIRSQMSPPSSQAQHNTKQPPVSPLSRPRTRAQQQSTPASPKIQQIDNFPVMTTSTAAKNFSSSNSVISDVTQTSSGSKKRRYERRSTSLVHELRDGTKWIDVDEVEVFSVTESESEKDNNDDNNSDDNNDGMIRGDDTAATEDANDEHDDRQQQVQDATITVTTINPDPAPNEQDLETIHLQTEPNTPSKKSPGRPRKRPTLNATDNSPKRTRGRPKAVDVDADIDQPSSSQAPALSTSPTTDTIQDQVQIQGRVQGSTRTTRSQAAASQKEEKGTK